MRLGARTGRRLLATSLAAALACLGPASLALSHPAFGGVLMAIVEAERVEGVPDTVELRIAIVNNTENAVTLRGLRESASSEPRIAIERRRELFYMVFWQPVDFLRLEPGEAITLEPPDYRVVVQTRAPQRFTRGRPMLFADFGPLGEIVAYDVRSPAAAPSPPGAGGYQTTP